MYNDSGFQTPTYEEHNALMQRAKSTIIRYSLCYALFPAILLLVGSYFVLKMSFGAERAAESATLSMEEIYVDREGIIRELYGSRETYASEKTGSRADYVDKEASTASGELVIDEARMNAVYEEYLKEFDEKIVDQAVVDARVMSEKQAIYDSYEAGRAISARSSRRMWGQRLIFFLSPIVFITIVVTEYLLKTDRMERMDYQITRGRVESVYCKSLRHNNFYADIRIESGETITVRIKGLNVLFVRSGKKCCIVKYGPVLGMDLLRREIYNE